MDEKIRLNFVDDSDNSLISKNSGIMTSLSLTPPAYQTLYTTLGVIAKTKLTCSINIFLTNFLSKVNMIKTSTTLVVIVLST